MSAQNILNLVINGNWHQFLISFFPPLVTCLWLTFFGLASLSLFPKAAPNWFFSMAPVFGFGVLAVITSNIGVFTGVGNRFLFFVITVISTILIYFRRANLREGLGQSSVSWAAGVILVLSFGLLPSISITSGQVLNHASTNHDAFFYAANEKWVASHSYAQTPSVVDTASDSSDSPGSMPAYSVRELNIRDGDGLVSAFINAGSNFEISKTWYLVRTAWMWLGFISILAASQLLGLTKRRAFVAAILATTSWQVVFQMYNQNAPAIIGLSLIPISFALGLKIREQTSERNWIVSASVIVFSIYLTTYGELLPFAAFAFVLTAFSSWKHLKARLFEVLIIGSLALAITPYASYEGMRYILRVSGVVNSLGAPQYWARPLLDIGGDVFGLSGEFPLRGLLTTTLILALMLGVIYLRRKTHSMGPIIWISAIVVLWLKLGKSGAFYSTDRLVQTMSSTVIWLGIVGLLSISNLKTKRTAVAHCILILFATVNLLAPLNYLQIVGNLDWRTYPGDLATLVNEALQKSNDGEDLMIASNRYVDRLWITNLCFREINTEYAFLTPDYFRMITKFDDNRPDQLLLTNLKLVGDSGIQLKRTDEYQLLSMKGASAALLSPVFQDQTEGNGNTISGTGLVEFRTLVWGDRPDLMLKFEIEGISSEAQLVVDGIDRSQELKNSNLNIVLAPGSHSFQILQDVHNVGSGWKVKLLQVQALG